MAEVQMGIQMDERIEEVFEFWKFRSIVADDPRGCTNYKTLVEFWGSRSGVTESVLLRYEAASMGNQILMFRGNLTTAFSKVNKS